MVLKRTTTAGRREGQSSHLFPAQSERKSRARNKRDAVDGAFAGPQNPSQLPMIRQSSLPDPS